MNENVRIKFMLDILVYSQLDKAKQILLTFQLSCLLR